MFNELVHIDWLSFLSRPRIIRTRDIQVGISTSYTKPEYLLTLLID